MMQMAFGCLLLAIGTPLLAWSAVRLVQERC